MPLGVELAAAWVRVLSCEEIAGEIEHCLDILATPARNVEPRHRNVRATFEPTWNRLSEEEQSVFKKLSVFRGGFRKEAAQVVAGARLPVLSALVDKSLLRVDAYGRYQLHELLRQYAQEQLEQNEEEVSKVGAVHTTYYADFLHQREPDIYGLRQPEVMREIAVELDNIRAAWWRAVDDADIGALQKSAYVYHSFCDNQGRYQEHPDAAGKAIERLEAIEPTRQRDLTLATLHMLVGWEYIRLGRYEHARTALQTSVTMFHDLGARPQPGLGTNPLSGLGLLAVILGNYAEAIAFGEAARSQSQAANDKLNLQIALYVLASAAYSQGQYETALRHARQVYDLCEESGNRWFTAHILGVMGNIARELEGYDRAWEYYQMSYTLKQEFDDLGSMGFALNGLAQIAWLRKDYERAARLYQQGHDLYREANDPGGLATSIFGLGDTAQATGDYPTARRRFEQALKIALDIHWSPLILVIMTGVSHFLLNTGEAEQAVELLAIVVQHPANEPPTRRRAEQLLERARTMLPPAVFDAARSRGETADLDSAAHSLWEQLNLLKAYPVQDLRLARQELIEPLTVRELEVLCLIADGLTNRQIGERLFLAVGTVKFYASQIYSKLHVENRVQALTRARELNLLS